jgi:hypothetical protein
MGTITGATLFDKIGVAPGAEWIASNAVASTNDEFDNSVLAAFEWFADPDGDPATSDDVPDVVQNSWGVSPGLGPYLDCDSTWWEAIDNCEAAGVVVLFSAGNDGPSLGTVRSPANRAASPINAFAVGSTITSIPYSISFFSSRGPSVCGGEFDIKPEVAAPGSDILSAVPGGGYAFMSGTSMAGPHVAGVVALMRQANPDVDVATIKEILMETATDLGRIGEDNDYGHGLVDAHAAVMAVLTDVGSVAGTVNDAMTGQPVVGAVIDDLGSEAGMTTGSDGAWGFTTRAGPKVFSVEKFGYDAGTVSVEIPAGATVLHDIELQPSPWATLAGVVTGPDGSPHEGATVRVLDAPIASQVTGVTGEFAFVLPAGPEVGYSLLAVAPDLAYDLRRVGLQSDADVMLQLPFVRGDGFESGGFAPLAWRHEGASPWFVDPSEARTGAFSARSGAITDGQTSELVLDYYVNGPGPISFEVMGESEVTYDRLVFSVDGIVSGVWSGSFGWSHFEHELEEGLHELRWVYTKDSSVTVPRDAVWIDELVLPGTGIRPFAALQLESSQYELETQNDSMRELVFPLGNAGTWPLDYSIDIVEVGTGLSPAWASLEPGSGSIEPGNRRDLVLTVDGYGAGAGLSQIELRVSSNDPEDPLALIGIDVLVAGVTATDPAPGRRVHLSGARPNPFNPSTQILFEIPGSMHVSLVIYDVAGRMVRELVDERREAGSHTVRWNGADASGRPVSSGVYYARLSAGNVTQSRPLTLVR